METNVLRRPRITERSTLLKKDNKYVFEVSSRATKGQIKEEVARVFRVEVTAVNTCNMPGKVRRRMGGKPGLTSEWKKAIVTVRTGQEIKFAEPKG